MATEQNDDMQQTQTKLMEMAKSGNIEAIKALHQLQQFNRFNELVNNMDDDEFTL